MDRSPMKTANAGSLSAIDAGSEVTLAGWIGRRRDHGGVIFVDLRDASGVVQVVLNPEEAPASEEGAPRAQTGVLRSDCWHGTTEIRRNGELRSSNRHGGGERPFLGGSQRVGCSPISPRRTNGY